jgi:hypothetical protein
VPHPIANTGPNSKKPRHQIRQRNTAVDPNRRKSEHGKPARIKGKEPLVAPIITEEGRKLMLEAGKKLFATRPNYSLSIAATN